MPCHALHATAHRRLQRAVNGAPQPQRSAVRQWVCHSAMFAVQLSEWGYAAAQQQCRGRVDCSAMPCSAHCSAQGTGQPQRRRGGGGSQPCRAKHYSAQRAWVCAVVPATVQLQGHGAQCSAMPAQRSEGLHCSPVPLSAGPCNRRSGLSSWCCLEPLYSSDRQCVGGDGSADESGRGRNASSAAQYQSLCISVFLVCEAGTAGC